MAEALRRCRPLLGTFVEICADREAAIEAAFAAVEQVHRLMSAHDPDSDVSRINRFAHRDAVEVHSWTSIVLERALFWAKESEGGFDAVRAGRAALERGLLPRHADQSRPEASHWTGFELQGRTVRLLEPGCLDLGGIAKGFAVDKAVEALRSAGAAAGLVNAGGDLAAFGPDPQPVFVVHPRTRQPLLDVDLANEAMATSAVLPDEQSTHLPGRSARLISATVRAPNCSDADALTKVLLADSPLARHCLELADADALTIAADGSIESVERLAA